MNNNVNGIGDYLGHMLMQIVAAVPKLLGALLILLIGYFIAKWLGKLVNAGLDKFNLDGKLHTGRGGNFLQRAFPRPSDTLGTITFWVVFLFAISAAVSALGIPALVTLVAGIYAYLPNVLAALAIFLVAGTVSTFVAGLIGKAMGDTPTGKVLGTVAPVLIMGIATFMILSQLLIAPAIVTITYAALMGGTALALALAFGLGGREVASRMLSDLHSKAQENKGAVAADVQVGKRRAEHKAYEVKSYIQ